MLCLVIPSGQRVLTTNCSSHFIALYDPRAFFTHAALLRQAFAHCARFLTAASRRSLDRVSVPVWLIILSKQLLIIALVSLYPTNKLIRRELILRQPKLFHLSVYEVLAAVSSSYSSPTGRFSRITHPFATKVKNFRSTCMC